MRRPTWLVLALLALVVVVQLLQSRRPEPATEGGRTASSAPAGAAIERVPGSAGPQQGFGASVGFRTRQRLLEHFDKHGAKFGVQDAAAYLARAQALRDAPLGGPVLEAVRADGVVSRFDRRDGTFIAFERDGTIRTCFRPNDGERYFQRQARRPAEAP